MRLAYRLVLLFALLPFNVVPAQAIAHTVASAEMEGRQLGPPDASAEQSGPLVSPFRGTAERRCVVPPSEDSLANHALRSGEIAARTRFSGPAGFRAGRSQKVLWLPLHAVRGQRVPLLLRAARIGEPQDTVRKTIPGSVYSHGSTGYPSAVLLPTAGEWVVVATAGRDWGCFLLHVDD
jgi:hypothetical protein